MSQNLVSRHLGSEQWSAVDGGLDAVEGTLGPVLVALDARERQRKVKMGDASLPFCQESIDVFRLNEHLLPRSLDIDEMRRDLESHNALNLRIARLTQLLDKARQTEMALGSDVMSAALEGYKVLKATGKGQGMETLQRMLGERFEGNGAKNEPVPPAK